MIFKCKYSSDLSVYTDVNGKYVWLLSHNGNNYDVYPLDQLSTSNYIDYIYNESSSIVIDPSLVVSLTQEQIDTTETNRINSPEKYIQYNEIIPADSIATIDDMKQFRTKVAELLYAAYLDSTDSKLIAMLTYYKNGMTDAAVELLSDFRNVQAILSPSGAYADCGCATKPLQINLGAVSVCDPLESYRKSVHDYMVQMFSNADFWKVLGAPQLQFIIDMLKGIVSANFPISNLSGILGYGDCSCLTYGTAQESAMKILSNLITSFEYIRDGEDADHKNFVWSTLNSWANGIYEVMMW